MICEEVGLKPEQLFASYPSAKSVKKKKKKVCVGGG